MESYLRGGGGLCFQSRGFLCGNRVATVGVDVGVEGMGSRGVDGDAVTSRIIPCFVFFLSFEGT